MARLLLFACLALWFKLNAAISLAAEALKRSEILGYRGPVPTTEDLFFNVTAMADACPGEKTRLVLSLACYAKPEHIAPFVRSWLMHSHYTRIVLMTDNDLIYKALHRPPAVHVVMIKPLTDNQLGKMPWWSWRMFGYLHYFDACKAKGTLPQGIITADARDSMALGDPWTHPLAIKAVEQNMTIFSYENQVYDNGETGVLLNKNEPWDRRMLLQCFKNFHPHDVMQHMLNSPLSCAGAQIGSGQAMHSYQKVLLDLAMHQGSAECMMWADQGLHNFMLHVSGRLQNQLPFKWEAYANGASWLYTASVAMPIEIDTAGVISVKRKNWHHYPLYIHKYDRNATVKAVVAELYGLSLNTKK